MNFFSFSSGLHCDAIWTNSWWHFHTGLQLPAVRCAGLCHRTFQLWWQNRLWITHKSSVVDSHLNQHATNPHSHQINPASLDSPTLPVIGVDNSNGSSNVTIPAVVLLLSVWVPPGVRHKIVVMLSSDLAWHGAEESSVFDSQYFTAIIWTSGNYRKTHHWESSDWRAMFQGDNCTPHLWRCLKTTNIIKGC